MDFELSDKAKAVEEQLSRFMDEYVYPAEWEYQEQAEANPNEEPSIMLELRAKARGNCGRAVGELLAQRHRSVTPPTTPPRTRTSGSAARIDSSQPVIDR